MAEILTQEPEQNVVQKSWNPFKKGWNFFSSQGKGTKFAVLGMLLIAVATPAGVLTFQSLNQHAAEPLTPPITYPTTPTPPPWYPTLTPTPITTYTGTALQLNNEFYNNTYVSAHTTFTLTNPFTIEAWVNIPKPMSGNYIREYPIITDADYPGIYEPDLLFQLSAEVDEQSGTWRPGFSVLTNTDNGGLNSKYIEVFGSNAVLQPYTWHHIAVTSYTKNNFCYLALYIDGKLNYTMSRGTGSNTITKCDIGRRTQQEFRIGKPEDGAAGGINGYYFNGVVDAIRISSKLRYTHDFNMPTHGFVLDANTLALWHFNNSGKDDVSKSGTVVGAHYQYVNIGLLPTPSFITPTPTPTNQQTLFLNPKGNFTPLAQGKLTVVANPAYSSFKTFTANGYVLGLKPSTKYDVWWCGSGCGYDSLHSFVTDINGNAKVKNLSGTINQSSDPVKTVRIYKSGTPPNPIPSPLPDCFQIATTSTPCLQGTINLH